jgi:hypothetical protein
LLRNPRRGGQDPTWAVEPYDDEVLNALSFDII